MTFCESTFSAGYHVTILFLWLPSADLAIERVRWRVAQGGHAIREE
jgi:predicted ABC-type ATPase